MMETRLSVDGIAKKVPVAYVKWSKIAPQAALSRMMELDVKATIEIASWCRGFTDLLNLPGESDSKI